MNYFDLNIVDILQLHQSFGYGDHLRDSDVYKNNREEGNFSVCNIGTDDNKNSGKCESVRSSKSSCGHGDCSNSTQTQN
eukprot:Awhi_evm1s9125